MPTGELARRTQREAYGTIALTFAVVLPAILCTESTETDGAAAAVGAAVIGIAGTSLGHAVGFDRGRNRKVIVPPADGTRHKVRRARPRLG